eukprot:m.309487 g.309487  ORF g.309487 m.309487 type:complete len:585 (+) comp46630_c0_seq1:75-1829(+)
MNRSQLHSINEQLEQYLRDGFANPDRARKDLQAALSEFPDLFCSVGRTHSIQCADEGIFGTFSAHSTSASLSGPISIRQGRLASPMPVHIRVDIDCRYPTVIPLVYFVSGIPSLPESEMHAGGQTTEVSTGHLPYLHNWNPDSSRLNLLLRALRDLMEGNAAPPAIMASPDSLLLQEVRQLENRLAGVNASLEEAKRERLLFREQVEQLHAEKTCLQKDYDDLQRRAEVERDDLRTQRESLWTEKKSLEETNRRTETEMRKELRGMTGQIRDLQRRFVLAEGEKQSVQRQLAQFVDPLDIKPEEVKMTEKLLGSGGFGDVYVGVWKGMLVAVKRFHEQLQGEYYKKLFSQELLVSSRFHHPNVVQVCGVTSVAGNPVQVVMELLEASLVEVLGAALSCLKTLSFREQIDLSENVCSGIAYLHQLLPRPYLHCDIRPSNILVTRGMVAKIGDLGAVHAIGASTSAGILSIHYIAPERFGSLGKSSIESDIYSLGVTLVELFSGEAASKDQRFSQIGLIADTDLQEICLQTIDETSPENRLPASNLLTLIQDQKGKQKYGLCPSRRMVIGKVESSIVKLVELARVD